ncbi:MAG: hypothetical protein AB3N23_17260 [Paracoccaceae bacterium]
MTVADALVMLVQYWLIAGAVVAVLFLVIGIDRIDEDARGAYVFRPLLVPAVLLIWPLILWRWFVLETGRDNWAARHHPPRRQHFYVAIILAVLIPLTFASGLSLRQTWPADVAPVQLSKPAGEDG